MSAPVNTALLGSGLFATTAYCPALQHAPSLHVTTVWSRSEKSATSLRDTAASAGGFPHGSKEGPVVKFGDAGLEDILADPAIKAVVLVLPIVAQPALIRRAWAAGKHVMSEKPIAKDVKEARALIKEYEEVYKPKGISWRVAENYASEILFHKARKLLERPEMGQILYWRMHMETLMLDGASYHGTTWRTIPAYQGGFILDGGVHWAALLRVILPERARPLSVSAHKALHRAHMPPHDTLIGTCAPSPESATPALGATTTVDGVMDAKSMPVQPGKSAPFGSFILSWSLPDTARDMRPGNELYIVAENGTMRITLGKEIEITVSPAISPDGKKAFEPTTIRDSMTGVAAELEGYGACINESVKSGKIADGDSEPQAALWDLAFIQAALDSDGRLVNIEDVRDEKA